LALVALTCASIPALYAGLLHPPEATTHTTLRQLHMTASAFAAVNIGLGLLAALTCWFIALMMLVRSGRHRAVTLMGIMLFAFGGALPGAGYAIAAQIPIWDVPYAIPQQALGWLSALVFACVFPDGRLVPSWTRLYLFGAAAWVASFFLVAPRLSVQHVGRWILVGLAIWAAWFAAGIYAQGYRYLYVATPSQRQQTKWVVVGFSLAMSGALVAVVLYVLMVVIKDPPVALVLIHLASIPLLTVGALAVPISVAIAVTRYHLFDIDFFIQRTLLYGTLSAVLVLVSAVCVVLARTLVGTLGGSLAVSGLDAPAAVAFSTLAVSALIQPMRRRVQTVIDQRFYRRKYDAERTLAEFAASLRTEFDLAQFEQRLLTVVERTMQPEHVSLWLRPPTAPPLPSPDDLTPPVV
ncbi:MAG TPA: hypothetical protein VGR57_21040, partial [Ktedonobacterales bacterium]|nr:hypothetical protein [Ktedonobacterales bacterium]